MKIFVISLEDAIDRRRNITRQLNLMGLDYEVVDAIRGSKLSPAEREQLVDVAAVARNPRWLTDGAIGCSLSHLKVYQKIVDEGLPYAVILEDDALLLPDFAKVVKGLEDNDLRFDIVLLYFTSWNVCELQSNGRTQVSPHYYVYPPKDIGAPITTTGYLVRREACKRMIQNLYPVRYAADSWAKFQELGCISSVGCVYPFVIDVLDSKSTIDYVSGKWATVSEIIDRYKIFPFYQLLKYRRKFSRRKMMRVSIAD